MAPAKLISYLDLRPNLSDFTKSTPLGAHKLVFPACCANLGIMFAAAVLMLGTMGQAALACGHQEQGPFRRSTFEIPLSQPTLSINGIAFSTRAHWMRAANLALDAPCPFAAFGSVIVNHTSDSELGELICSGANANSVTGNPTLHGTPTLPSPQREKED